jgi:hypothetical protein
VPQRAIDDGTISRFGYIDPTDGGRSHRHSLIAAWQRGSARSVTRVEGLVSEYGLGLFSNFTYLLDDPENGDQFEQKDDRWIGGLRASRLWVLGGTDHPTELTIGTQLRYDDIAPVGLYHTMARERLSTVREDDVRQASGAAYLHADTQWAARVRTVLGLRGDVYRFDVNSSDPRNSGRETATRPSPKLSVALGPWARTELYASYGLTDRPLNRRPDQRSPNGERVAGGWPPPTLLLGVGECLPMRGRPCSHPDGEGIGEASAGGVDHALVG